MAGPITAPAQHMSPPVRRKRSARFTEIALEAEVSVSTVDRVLNERGSVSDGARRRVIEAARALAVPRVLPETRHGLVHIDILISEHGTPFVRRLEQAVRQAVALLPGHVVVHRQMIALDDEAAFERAILQPPYARAGLVALAPRTPRILDALAGAIGRGEALSTMVNDLPELPPHHFAGIDNARAGRTAGYWLGRLARRKGSVLILPGMRVVPAHEDRMRGCAEALREFFPALQALVSPETHEDPDLCYRYVSAALKGELAGQRAPLVGIYDTAYGSPGIEPALRGAGMAGKVAWIGHEMLDRHRQYLAERSLDMVIDQNPDGQVRSALQHVLFRCGLIDSAPPPDLHAFDLFTLPNMRMAPYLDG